MAVYERNHHTMVDFCVDMKPEEMLSMINDHYPEFVNAYRSASQIADNGDSIKFVVEDNSLKIKMNKGMDASKFCGYDEHDPNCTSIRLQ